MMISASRPHWKTVWFADPDKVRPPSRALLTSGQRRGVPLAGHWGRTGDFLMQKRPPVEGPRPPTNRTLRRRGAASP